MEAKNMAHNEEKNQSPETGPKLTQILKVAGKDTKTVRSHAIRQESNIFKVVKL